MKQQKQTTTGLTVREALGFTKEQVRLIAAAAQSQHDQALRARLIAQGVIKPIRRQRVAS